MENMIAKIRIVKRVILLYLDVVPKLAEFFDINKKTAY